VGGYPNKEIFEKSVFLIEKTGFDFIEIGLPFSEPVADGPVIVKAIETALKNNTKVNYIIDFLEKLKTCKFKKYIMTYSNIVYDYGIKKFSKDFKEIVNSIIIADLPNKMHCFFYDHGFEIPIIPFVTPESRKKDIELIKELKGDFVYFIAIRGITGGKFDFNQPELREKIETVKKETQKKVIMGFGLKNNNDAEKALLLADGYVIGTEAVKRQTDLNEFEKFLFTFAD